MKVKSILSMIWNIIFYSFVVIILVLTVSLSKTENPGQGPSIFGYKFYTVLTGSMSPTIGKGYLTIVKESEPNEIKVNDVITFGNSSNNNVTTHRVKEIDSKDGIKFITQGDANSTIDPSPVDSKYLVGKVIYYIPFLGATFEFIRANIKIVVGFLLIITIMGLLPSKNKKEVEKVKQSSMQ